MPHSSSDSMWTQIEIKIKDNLEKFENSRKFCTYCGITESSSGSSTTTSSSSASSSSSSSTSSNDDETEKRTVILGRCYGCQMVYYCSQEHQHLDWLENHMPKCAELEWVSLCELVQSVPVNLSLTSPGMNWPNEFINQINTWTDWFDIRPDLVESIRHLAKSIETELFLVNKTFLPTNKFNRREPSLNDLTDGLLAKVTDSMSYALTLGNAIQKLGINLNPKPICIHVLYPTNDLIEDLVYLFMNNLNDNEIKLERCEIDNSMKKKFYELLNMFPSSKGIELVFISTNPIVDSSCFDNLNPNTENVQKPILIDWSKLLPSPLMKKDLNYLLNNKRNLFISAWQGSYSNYIKYACNSLDGYLEPDLVVSFHPNFTKSPQKLINDWTDDLKIILTNNIPCLFTFNDKEEKQKAFQILNAFQTNFLCSQSNQFSSLLLKQTELKPNQVYSTNGFCMIIRGFKTEQNFQNDLRSVKIFNEQQKLNSISGVESLKRSKSIHDLFTNQHYLTYQQQQQQQHYQIQNDACVQTMGLDEPENPSLRHINGKLQINKSNCNNNNNNNNCMQQMNTHRQLIYKSTDNINRINQPSSLNMIDILIDNTNSNEFDNNYHRSHYNTATNQPPPPLIQQQQQHQHFQQHIPLLDYSLNNKTGYRPSNFMRSQPHLAILTQIDHDIKLNYSNRLKISPKPDTKSRYYQPRLLVRPSTNYHDQNNQSHNQQTTELLMYKKEEESTYNFSSTTRIIQHSNTGLDVYQQEKEEFEQSIFKSDHQNSSNNNNPPIVVTRTRKSSISSSTMPTCLSIGTEIEDIDLIQTTNQVPNTKPRNGSNNLINVDESKSIPFTKPRNNNNYVSSNLASDDPSTSSSASLKDSEINTSSNDNKKQEETPKPRLKKFNQQIPNPLPKPRYSVKLDSSENESDHLVKDNEMTKHYNHNQTLKSLKNKSNSKITESSLKKEIELLTPPLSSSSSSTSSSSSSNISSTNISASSSTRSSTHVSSSLSPRSEQEIRERIATSSSSSFTSSSNQNGGFVNQMKNIFESPTKKPYTSINSSPTKRDYSSPLNAKKNTKTFNIYEPPVTHVTQQQSPKKQPEEEKSEYMNVSNKYLLYSKLKNEEKALTRPLSPPPPVPPPPPLPTSPPPDISSPDKTRLFEIGSLESSPFKQPVKTTENLVSKIISTQTTPIHSTPLLPPPPAPPLPQTFSDLPPKPESAHAQSSNNNNTHQSLKQQQQKQRLMSNTSSCTNYTLRSDFRILNTNNLHSNSSHNQSERSVTPSSKSLNSLLNNTNMNRVMIKHIPDAVDEVKLEYEGQRHVVVPGYMTSADILRNILLNNNLQTNELKNSLTLNVNKSNDNLTLKEKLMLQESKNKPISNSNEQAYFNPIEKKIPVQNMPSMRIQANYQHQPEPQFQPQQQPVKSEVINNESNLEMMNKIEDDDDDILMKKFTQRSRTRSMSGVLTLDLNVQTTQIIDIDLDYDSTTNEPKEQETTKNHETIYSSVLQSETVPIPISLAQPQPAPPQLPPHIPIKPPRTFQQLNNIIENHYVEPTTQTHQFKLDSTRTFGSTRTTSTNNSSRRISNSNHQRLTVTGSFDPNDFDSFDEDEDYCCSNNFRNEMPSNRNDYMMTQQQLSNHKEEVFHIPLESIEKIREDGIIQQKIENDIKIQEMNLVQFDPDDFDSFDEDDGDSNNTNQYQSQPFDESYKIPIQIEQLPVIKLDDSEQSNFSANRNKIEAIFNNNNNAKVSKPPEPICPRVSKKSLDNELKPSPVKTNEDHNNQTNFFRSALDRISTRSSKIKTKTRSSSVPLRTLISSELKSSQDETDYNNHEMMMMNQKSRTLQPNRKENSLIANVKTLNLMNKMQLEYEEKQRRKKLRREQKLEEERRKLEISRSSELTKSPKTPNEQRKFLSSIINTLFSSSGKEAEEATSSGQQQQKLVKNDSKRLSLRRLKAKDKAKKNDKCTNEDELNYSCDYDTKSEINYQSDGDYNVSSNKNNNNFKNSKSNPSLNLDVSSSSNTDDNLNANNDQDLDIKLNLLNQARLNGRIKNENLNDKIFTNQNNKENLMKQLKAELDEEIKDRKLVEHKNNIINGTACSSTGSSLLSNSDNYNQRQSLKSSTLKNQTQQSESNRKIRSKSVTFLDEISTDDEGVTNTPNVQLRSSNEYILNDYRSEDNRIEQDFGETELEETNNPLITPSSARKNNLSLKAGDARLFAGALTGVGPIRSIMKKSTNDLGIIELGTSTELPKVQLNYFSQNDLDYDEFSNGLTANSVNSNNGKMVKSQTTPNLKKREQILQSDL